MKKRQFLKLTGILGAGVVVAPFMACSDTAKPAENAPETPEVPAEMAAATVFTLPELGYAFDALAPNIDAMTMEIHHGKHHAGYVRKLNAALESAPQFGGMTLAEILGAVTDEDTGVRNNGGGHFNHSMYWKTISPSEANAPTGALLEAITAAFGSVEAFSEAFFKAAKTRFGSGWAWLSKDDAGKLFISSTPNQDNPMMTNVVEQAGTPILGIDVWEHAYYLNYQNKRGDYITAFMELINWDEVAKNFMA